MRIPSRLLAKLYVKGSLHNEREGFGFSLKNVLAPGTVVKLLELEVDGKEQSLEDVGLRVDGGECISAAQISSRTSLSLDLGAGLTVKVRAERLSGGSHEIGFRFLTREVGEARLVIRDTV